MGLTTKTGFDVISSRDPLGLLDAISSENFRRCTMSDQQHTVIIAKGITFRGTGVRFQPPADQPKSTGERKVYIMNGANYIPSPTAQKSPEKPSLLEVKEEPLEEEDFVEHQPSISLPEQPFHVKAEEPEPQPSTSCAAPPVCISTPKPLKRPPGRPRKRTYLYDNDDPAPILSPEEPTEKVPRMGCRCDHVLPVIEKRMDWMMEKMTVFETMVQTLLSRSEEREAAFRTQIMNANSEIALLKRQLVKERNWSTSVKGLQLHANYRSPHKQ